MDTRSLGERTAACLRGLGVHTLVSNTNTSASTEEGDGFGAALLDFVTELASREVVPQAPPHVRPVGVQLKRQ